MNPIRCRVMLLCMVATVSMPIVTKKKPKNEIVNNVGLKNSVVNSRANGRYGDQVMVLLRCAYLWHKYKLNFYSHPFTGSDQLLLHTIVPLMKPVLRKHFQQRSLVRESEIRLGGTRNLFTTSYWFEGSGWHSHQLGMILGVYAYSMVHPDFKHAVEQMLTPNHDVEMPLIPKDRVSIAVHIRKGGGYDQPLASQQLYRSTMITKYVPIECTSNGAVYTIPDELKNKRNFQRVSGQRHADRTWPLRFPPEQFFVDNIRKIATLLPDKKLYVHVCTDDPNPQAVCDRIEKAVDLPEIQFGSRVGAHKYNSSYIDDMFIMAQCDCLIRPESSFSNTVQMLGRHKIIIWPLQVHWSGAQNNITHAAIINHITS